MRPVSLGGLRGAFFGFLATAAGAITAISVTAAVTATTPRRRAPTIAPLRIGGAPGPARPEGRIGEGDLGLEAYVCGRLNPVKVFISVDMEGISGVTRWQDVVASGQDYQRARSWMTADVNA